MPFTKTLPASSDRANRSISALSRVQTADPSPNRDPFAHFLRAGTYGDRDPSPDFDAAAYRKRVLGRPSRHFRRLLHPERDNPLVHWLGAQYEAATPSTLDAV